MSDYLWDKTGEPDEEVERLEALLGTLAHRPRPLALPARDAHAAPVLARPSRLSAPWALAAAAALLVATLAGAAALLRSRETPAGKDAAAAAVANETRPSQGEAGSEKPAEETLRENSQAAPEPARGAHAAGASKGEKVVAELKDERTAVEAFVRGRRAWKATRVASAQSRQKGPAPAARVGATEQGGGATLEAMSAAGGAPSMFESARLMTKEQLVFALRLTGAKLRDVRQKTRQGLSQEASEQP